MKTVPLNGGTVPLRGSKNPVLGVFRHHCGSIATVHQPKGRKAHLRYLLCDECGNDQCSGASYQEKIRANMQPNIEALLAAEGESPEAPPEVTPTEQPIETAPDVVLEVVTPTVEQVTEQPTQTTNDVVSEVVEQLQPEPKPQPVHTPNKPAANDPIQPKKLAVCIGLGGLIGGLFALAR